MASGHDKPQTVRAPQVTERSPRHEEKIARVECFRSMDKWIVFASVCFRILLSSGSLKSNGVILDDLVHELNSSHSLVAWAFSLQSGIAFMATPITRMLLTVLSNRKIGIMGGLLVGTGYVYCGLFAVSVVHVFVGYALSGFGFALAILPSYLALKEQFVENFSTATAASAMFHYFGMSILPPVMKVFQDHYGLYNSLILLGAILWNLVACGVAIRLPHDKQTSLEAETSLTERKKPEGEKVFSNTEVKSQRESSSIGVKWLPFCSSLVHHKTFVFLLIFSVVGVYVLTSWVIFLVSFGTTQGLLAKYSVLLSTAGGLGGLGGKLLGAILFHLRKMNPYICCFPFLITGLTFLISIFTRNFYFLSVLTFLAGLTQGLTSSGLYGTMPLIVCKHHFPQAVALLSFIEGIAVQCSGIFSGLIHDLFGSSRYVFGFNAILCFAVSPLMFLWVLSDQTVKQCKPGGKLHHPLN